MKIDFYIRFKTRFGQSLLLTGDPVELGERDPQKAVLMEYLNEEFWMVRLEVDAGKIGKNFLYQYILKSEDGELLYEWEQERVAILSKSTEFLELVDTWNHAGEFENAFYTAPFKKVLLGGKRPHKKIKPQEHHTHIFRVKAPLIKKSERVCVCGSGLKFADWSEPVLLHRDGDWWSVGLDLSGETFPIVYKYAIYDGENKSLQQYENGENRILNSDAAPNKLSVLHDGFIHLSNNTWKGAGVAVPVFSLRSKKSFGVGEFTDIKLLVNWARRSGLRMIQLLPVNDTISTNSWRDSYPYSAVSAFALHPIYINLVEVAGKQYAAQLDSLKGKQEELNSLDVVNYEEVVHFKISVLKELYEFMGEDCLKSQSFKDFFSEHKDWLQPYAAFCLLRERYGTADFSSWPSYSTYVKEEVADLCSKRSTSFREIGFYYFVQYHLHLQLKGAADHAHKKGVVLKGDIPIGISRNSADAWVSPDMYNLCWQAGAPPDDFTAIGQNWGFPTYNWKKMQEDGFTWWKQRFEQMSDYFDAFRIDHILGFFRIWSIPANAVQGIMGRFVPCLPIHRNEFSERGIWLDHHRYCSPYITDEVLNVVFGDLAGEVRTHFLVPHKKGGYELKDGFSSQVEIQAHFESVADNENNRRIRDGLMDLVSNVILFEDHNPGTEGFHFRISVEKTSSFQHLDASTQQKLMELYTDYFYHRQDDFWYREAMHKLPRLKAVTQMLVCGEDLGMVPHCVPDVMQQLGILSLEIQRMPKIPGKEFFHPKDAPYLSVITPSTHDMSTIRGWWLENRYKTQHFFNSILGQPGEAPLSCDAWISRAIIIQHLYSPAMWSIFQLQDILGMDENLRREDPTLERINDPANPKHYWQYRMHISLEELIKQKEFNEELKEYVHNSGR